MILAATYLDENMLYKISRIKTNSVMLDKNLQIFFKLINFKHRFEKNEEYWKIWLKEEYLKQTNINLEKDRKLQELQKETCRNEILEEIKMKCKEPVNITYNVGAKDIKHFEWINIKNVQQMIVNHINYMYKEWNQQEQIGIDDNQN